MSTACELLTEALGAYEKVAGELEEFRGRVARAESEEAAVLANTELSEHETVKRLGEAQRLKGIYSARAAHHEARVSREWREVKGCLRWSFPDVRTAPGQCSIGFQPVPRALRLCPCFVHQP